VIIIGTVLALSESDFALVLMFTATCTVGAKLVTDLDKQIMIALKVLPRLMYRSVTTYT